jgi:hypothetical protein
MHVMYLPPSSYVSCTWAGSTRCALRECYARPCTVIRWTTDCMWLVSLHKLRTRVVDCGQSGDGQTAISFWLFIKLQRPTHHMIKCYTPVLRRSLGKLTFSKYSRVSWTTSISSNIDFVMPNYEGCYESSVSPPPREKCICNSSEIYMDHSYIFCTCEAIFLRSLRHFQHTFANVE